jgi:gliding motility-associated-like protein
LGCTSADVTLTTAKDSTYNYKWTGPNNFSSSIYNPSLPKVTYNDSGLYTVLVTSQYGCKGIDSFNLKVFPGTTAKAGNDAMICEGTGIVLAASGGLSYNWTPAGALSNPLLANPLAKPVDTTVFKVTVTNQFGCKDTAKTTINVFKNPVITAGPDKQIFEGESTTLDGIVTGNVSSFYWSPTTAMSNFNSVVPTVSPTDSITYTLSVLPGQGCPVVSDKVLIRVFKKVLIPNAFSPNGDGINDTWIIKGLETYPDAILQVYSRTGRLLFQSKANSHPWDGTYDNKPVPLATYYYVIDLKINIAPISGWVVVLR